MRLRPRPVMLLALVALVACDAPAKTRYTLAKDPGSRHDFRFVLERRSRLWTHLHCELRVALARRLPEPISSAEPGDLMSTQYFTSTSMGSGDFVPEEFRVRDGYRVWLARSIARESDFDDSSSYGVQLRFPTAEPGPAPHDPMEIFSLPAFQTLVPYVWSPWQRADDVRRADFAGWEKLHGVAAEDAPACAPDADASCAPGTGAAPRAIEHPFEMRCRTVLWDRLYTPIEAEDVNVGKPDPSQAATR
jgi:hypothetical protein